MVLSFEVNSIYFIPVHGVSEAAVPVEISAAFKPPSRLALLSPLRSFHSVCFFITSLKSPSLCIRTLLVFLQPLILNEFMPSESLKPLVALKELNGNSM